MLASKQGGDMAESKLGGWWRLWVLLTVVLGVLVFVASFEPNPAKLEWVESVPADAKINYEKWRDEKLAGRTCKDAFVFPIRSWPLGARPNTPHTMQMSCNPKPDYQRPIALALIPGALLLMVGLAFAWVRAGFSSKPLGDN